MLETQQPGEPRPQQPATRDDHRGALIGLMVFFFLFWIVIPYLFPRAAIPVYWLTLPARHLGIFVHEMGHGLFTVLSGGRFFWFQMELMQGGVAVTAGGIRALTLLGGLLGPALMGALLLRASTRRASTRMVLSVLMIFFIVGLYFMFKPLFLSGVGRELGQGWSPRYLISAIVPGGMFWLTLSMRRFSEKTQRFYVQILGILICYSGFSDTRYIFHYERLSNGLFSDVRVLASLVWTNAESVPFWLFVFTASLVAVLNVGMMLWGVWSAMNHRNRPVIRAERLG